MRDENGSTIAEAGAGRIPETHTWAMSYVNRMGVETDPLYPDGLSAVIYAQGKRFVLGPGADPAQHFDLTDAEKMLGLDGAGQDPHLLGRRTGQGERDYERSRLAGHGPHEV